MSAPALSPAVRQAQDYLAAVEHELADLPVDDRSALLEDLALHLGALAAEDDDRPIAVRLGPAAAYAADLRAAAGLPARGSGARSAAVDLHARLDGFLAMPAVRRVVPAAREVRRLLGELRPAWWVLRGYLLVLVPCLHERDGVSDFPAPAPLDSHVVGALLVVLAVTGSVALGRRSVARPLGGLVGVLGAVLLFASFVAWESSGVSRGGSSGMPDPGAVDQALGSYPLLSRSGPVTDVLPYAADGTPLEGVLLYDQDGRPLQVGLQQWWADGCARVLEQPLAADGVPVPHSFPQSYALAPHLDPDAVGGSAVPAGRCLTGVPRPEVALPVFPAPGSAAAGQPAEPAPGG
jgi:hypothetical protein